MFNVKTDQIREGSKESDGSEPVIDINGLRFAWSKSKSLVLDIEHFSVKRGEMLFIMGESGIGKSTLLGIITGILVPQEGEVMILGQGISDLQGYKRDSFRADNIGYIFQMFNLIPYLSVIENVKLPCQFSSLKKARALQQSSSLDEGALRLLTHLNLKGDGLLNKPVVELSVGQQQRVAAARALIGRPELLIADEPTSSLDSAHRESFLRLLFDECSRSGSTLVFVSHDAGLTPLFDRVAEFREFNKAVAVLEGDHI